MSAAQGVLFSLVSLLAVVGKALAALLACFLPRKVFTRWSDRLPVFHMALPAALLTLVAGFVIGTVGYVEFATETASRNNAMLLEIAEKQEDGTAPAGADVSTAVSTSLMVLAALTFMFFTPVGLLATYLTATGLFRLISGFVGDAHGDTILTLAHSWFTHSAGRVEDRAKHKERLRRAGPEVPDQILTAEEAGIPRADLVVVTSRVKEDWTPDTILATDQGWFRVGAPEERQLPEGLRTFYPLREVAQAEVFRRVVRTTLPRLPARV